MRNGKYRPAQLKSTGRTTPKKRAPPKPPAPAADTRDTILNAAERLFGQFGFVATSTRTISQEAKVALGQLHYYYKTKRELFEAVYLRYGKLIVEERRQCLDDAIKAAKGRPVAPLLLVRAFIEPFYRQDAGVDRYAFILMHARLHSEPQEIARSVRSKIYDETMMAFVDQFRASLPHLPAEELHWRLTFMIGAYIYPLLRTGRLEVISRGACRADDMEIAVNYLARFLEGGLEAAPSRPRRKR